MGLEQGFSPKNVFLWDCYGYSWDVMISNLIEPAMGINHQREQG
jgi:hypothetical protein